MDVIAAQLLHQIGRQIHHGDFPRVWNGGLVTPNGPLEVSTLGDMERFNERWEESRSATGSRQGPAGRKGSTRGPRPAGEAAPVLDATSDATYGNQLNDLYQAYPNSVLRPQEKGFWLVVESTLLPALDRWAVFVIGINTQDHVVRSWGFWETTLSLPRWIGPRHTNFNDGSICAFEPSDGTWAYGEPLVDLVDIYSTWAIRHLHLEVIGHWPGYQAVHHPYERILEFRDGEHCGCNASGKMYRDCCYAKDQALDQLKAAINFAFWSRGGERKPPKGVVNFAYGLAKPPDVMDLLTLS